MLKMRILHVICTLDPASGGPCESVKTLMTFSSLGYTGEAVTLDDPESPFLKNIGFPVSALGPARSTSGFSLKMYRWIKDNHRRFDGVIVNGLWNASGVSTWLALRDKCPYMIFTHGMLDPYFKKAFPLKHLKKWIYWILIEYWVLRRAHRVLFTTKQESELARESFWLHRWQGYVVPYGSSRPPGEPTRLLEEYFQEHPAMRNRRFLLFLGRIHRKKGCDMLINSFERYADLDRELHLVVAGPDQQGWSAELREEIERAGLSKRVHWPGMLNGNVKWGALVACEAFILPSHQENFGIAVAEALSCGKPVLLADKVNIAPDIAQDGAGLMEADTQEGTDKLVREWINMSMDRKALMAENALTTFQNRYDMKRNAETIIRLFVSYVDPPSK